MQHKKIIVVWWILLGLLTLPGCGPKGIDDADLVSIEYKYTYSDWTLIEEWNKDFSFWNGWDMAWVESIIEWAKVDDEFTWTKNWKEVYKSKYNPSNIQSYPDIILTEVMWISDPKIWTEVEVNSIWVWIITNIKKDKNWYNVYEIDFNDPKTYSDLSYYIKITNIEKL